MILQRFILQPYGDGKHTRFTCPGCHKPRQFTRYIVIETGQHLHAHVGSCNRKIKCGYHYTPKAYFLDNPDQSAVYTSGENFTLGPPPLPNPNIVIKRKEENLPISYIPSEKLQESCRHYGHNNFTLFLRDRFGLEITERLINLYRLGTSRKWDGATIFWQIDAQNKVRTGKIMLYDRATGKRVKKPYNRIYWAHKVLKLEEFQLSQCLFGEHLLQRFPNKPVAVVESEKTAIICSVFLPRYIWLAAGGLTFLTEERCAALQGRKVTLFPDLGGYDKWSRKAAALAGIAQFTVSDLLERIATDGQREEGLDIGDFLLMLPPKK